MKKALISLISTLNPFSKSKKNSPEQHLSPDEKVIKALKSYGDNHSIPRQIDYWIYFKSEYDRDLFIQEILNDFKIENKSYDKSLGDLAYSLHISNINIIDITLIKQVTLFLNNKAHAFNGDYDGWETSIEK
ncbi:ribonuclease E inhibitor RraB [Flavobacterium alkalisoli]|uniref:Ribonuclease E inhibitor RraB n=1 Tax=Flavobacterium alkalisoli TaxID=2602769 RepID=A0A5B9FQV6_9FLAO|nr:ribonuclease E inhibitor RraB [Flavobacterium alkalisoli]QEE49713.1 ribonuclease E inhibitor RraB [Flavobacterium alkalisoli]